MKKVAIVGYGFMGRTHFGAWRRTKGAKVVAICDSCLSQITAKVTGNIKGAADNTTIPKSVRIYSDMDKMLAAGGFDIVDITLPTMLHRTMAERALRAGCHVICEKPMALNVRDCDAMMAAAKKAGRKLMVAHVVRFQPASRYLADLIASGKYGKVVAAEFSRYIAPPKWSPKGQGWFFDETKSGGVYLDAHIHDIDLMQALFGRPLGVVAAAHRRTDGYPDHTSAIFTYPGFLVTTNGSFAAADSLQLDASSRVFFERATVFVGARYQNELTVYPSVGKPICPRLAPRVTAYADELKYFLGFVEGRNDGSLMTPKSSRDSVAMAAAERRSAMKPCGKLSI